MNFLGIGPFELILVLIIALLILGPKEMANAGAKLGGFIRKVVTSDAWKAMRDTTKEIRNMPNKLAREAGLEEFRRQMREQESLGNLENPFDDIKNIDPALDAWTSSPKKDSPSSEGSPQENKIPENPTDQDTSS